MNWTLLQNSLVVSGLASILASALGFSVALALAAAETRSRRCLLALAVVALVLPPFLVTNCWLDLLGTNGTWRTWLPFNIYSIGGAVWLLTLLNWPISTLFVLGAWQRLERTQLESDPALRGLALLRWLLWPMARVAVGQAALLTFVLALNNFAVPVILQVPVFPEELWLAFTTRLDDEGAWAALWPLVLAPLVVLLCLQRTEVSWPRTEGTAAARIFRRQLGAPVRLFTRWLTAALLVFSVALPLKQLAFSSRTWTELPNLFRAVPDTIWNSFFYAALVATVCVAMGLVGWRLPVGWLLWLPFLIPGILLGRVLISAFNGTLLYGTTLLVLAAFTLRYLAPAWNSVAQARRGVDRDLTDAAQLDGASGWPLWRYVHWPQIAPLAAVAWYITYLLCLWDVETLVLLQPPGGETLALRIFNLLHYGHNAQVNALCVVLLALALAPLAGWVLIASPPFRRSFVHGLLALLTVLAGCSPAPSTPRTALDSPLFSHVEIIGTRGTGVGQFTKPRSVATDREDNLYVVDMTGRVQKFSPHGELMTAWRMPQTDLGRPKGMGRDNKGNIIVVEPHYQRVNHFTPDGTLVEQWGERGPKAGQLTLPRSVAVTSQGDIFLCEYTIVDRVQGFSAAGRHPLICFGKPGTGDGEFNRAEGLGIDAQDRLYVADSCNHRIQIFSTNGQWLKTYGHAGRGLGEFSYPFDVKLDEEGRQFVAELANNRIQIFSTNNQPIEILGRTGAKPGELNNPWSIAFDSYGNLYVADAGNHRVQKFVRRNPRPERGRPVRANLK